MSNVEKCRNFLSIPPILEKENQWFFRQPDKKNETTDSLDRIKLIFKRYSNFYYFLIKMISPVWSDQGKLRQFLQNKHGLVLNIGSGNEKPNEGVLNVDMMDYENVHLVCDIHSLPFKDNSVDAVINIAVLEHVRDPDHVIKEVYRVLKPNGMIFTVVPFMQPFHASPHDYQRYTLPGLKNLHKQFQHVESGVFSGPMSGFLWVAQEFIASTFSFGFATLYSLWTIVLLIVSWPLKFLDLLLIRIPITQNVASNFYFVGFKTDPRS